jgi:hypothetical protein
LTTQGVRAKTIPALGQLGANLAAQLDDAVLALLQPKLVQFLAKNTTSCCLQTGIFSHK